MEDGIVSSKVVKGVRRLTIEYPAGDEPLQYEAVGELVIQLAQQQEKSLLETAELLKEHGLSADHAERVLNAEPGFAAKVEREVVEQVTTTTTTTLLVGQDSRYGPVAYEPVPWEEETKEATNKK